MTPTCPVHWSCTFSPTKQHFIGPWYQGAGGLVCVILGIIALTIILGMAVYYTYERGQSKRAFKERELERRQKLAIEEQRSVQADSAKGDIEFLRVLRSER